MTTDKHLGLAISYASISHVDQFDKGGKAYILHPIRVMQSLSQESIQVQMVAILHDVVEDTSTTVEHIEKAFGKEIADAIDAISRRDGEVYMDYIKRCKLNPIAKLVKIADLQDNMSKERVEQLPESERGVVKRYEKALAEMLA